MEQWLFFDALRYNLVHDDSSNVPNEKDNMQYEKELCYSKN